MGFISDILASIASSNPLVGMHAIEVADHIFYKIVDQVARSTYLLQCINTEAIFQCEINEIVYDSDIMYRLHPVQACYIGIEYVAVTRGFDTGIEAGSKLMSKLTGSLLSRYGSYTIRYITRNGHVCFIDKSTSKEFIKDPRDIALTEALIREFDASQAFYIGLWAGGKFNNPIREAKEMKSSHLRLIK